MPMITTIGVMSIPPKGGTYFLIGLYTGSVSLANNFTKFAACGFLVLTTSKAISHEITTLAIIIHK